MRLDKAKSVWEMLIRDAAPLGKKAIEDYVKKWGDTEGYTVLSVNAETDGSPMRFRVHVDVHSEDVMANIFTFAVYNPNLQYDTRERNLAAIRCTQASLPPHLAGRPHNIDKFMTDVMMDKVKKATGYTGLAYGDLWFHSEPTIESAKAHGAHEGMISVGYLTKAGQIAFYKWIDVMGLKLTEPDLVVG